MSRKITDQRPAGCRKSAGAQNFKALAQLCLEDWETGWIPTNRDRPYGLPPQSPGARAGSVKLLAPSLVQRPGVNGKCYCVRAAGDPSFPKAYQLRWSQS